MLKTARRERSVKGLFGEWRRFPSFSNICFHTHGSELIITPTSEFDPSMAWVAELLVVLLLLLLVNLAGPLSSPASKPAPETRSELPSFVLGVRLRGGSVFLDSCQRQELLEAAPRRPDLEYRGNNGF